MGTLNLNAISLIVISATSLFWWHQASASLLTAPTQTYHSKDGQSRLVRYDYSRNTTKALSECRPVYVKLYWKNHLTAEKEVACVGPNVKIKWLPYGVWYGSDSNGFFWAELPPKHLNYVCRHSPKCVYVLGQPEEEELLDGTSEIHIPNESASSCRFEYLARLASGKTIYGVFNMEEGGVKFREPLSSIVIAQGEICI